MTKVALIFLAGFLLNSGVLSEYEVEASTCNVTQEQLDAEVSASGAYEITVEEFCSL